MALESGYRLRSSDAEAAPADPHRIIKQHDEGGGAVLDLFGGSGSTLIGAEQIGRRAYIMELDPRFVDVIIQRYENFLKSKAETKKKKKTEENE